MTPDEFEEYLGLAGTEGPLGAMDNAMYGTEPQRNNSSAIDRMIAGEFQGAIDDSYSHQPVISAKNDNEELRGENNDCGPSSMFDSFDQEEQRLVDQLAASERSKPST